LRTVTNGGYLRVNDHFARELHEVLEPNDLVWVHDYHLMPLAKALRDRGNSQIRHYRPSPGRASHV
jgi:trehalose-6-phosphate synthase